MNCLDDNGQLKIRMVQCQWNDCSAEMPDEHSLEVHIENIHLESITEWFCHWKGCKRNPTMDIDVESASVYGFPNRSSLIAHVRSHSGDKPFECQHCGRHFARSDALHKHSKACNPDNDEKKSKDFECRYDREPTVLGQLLMEKQQIPLFTIDSDLMYNGKPLDDNLRKLILEVVLEVKAYRHLRSQHAYWKSAYEEELQKNSLF